MPLAKERELKNRELGEKLPQKLWDFRKEESFCDVTIIVSGERFPAHKVVLCTCSEYFRTMFTCGFKESSSSEVTIEGDPKIFAKLLRFAYKGKMKILMDDLAKVLGMACYFQFEAAIHACESYLQLRYEPGEVDDYELRQEDPYYDCDLEEVPLETALEVERHASAHGLTFLTERNRRYIAENFKQFSVEPVFAEKCPTEMLLHCIGSKDLEGTFRKCNDTQVIQAVIKWLYHSWEDRKKHTLNLFNMVRLGCVDIAILRGILEDSKMMSIEECKELIEGVLQLHDTKETAVVPLHISHPESFASRNTITALITVEDVQHRLQFYDYEKRYQPLWCTLYQSPKLPCSKDHKSRCEDTYSLVVVNGHLYAAGDKSFFCLEYDASQWKQLASMIYPVKSCHLVELDGYIYAVNGQKHSERYNLKENTWETLPSRVNSGKLTLLSVVGFNGKLLVLVYGRYSLHAVQVYDPEVSKWYEVPLPEHSYDYKKPPILMVHDGALYRVAYDKEGSHPIVNHLQYVPDDKGMPNIILAELQEQKKGIPYKNRPGTFCIGQEVFIDVHGHVINLGKHDSKVASLLYKWRDVMSRSICNSKLNVAGRELAVFTFDKYWWT